MQQQNFITSISSETITACKQTNLFPSLMIAQACLESNYGQSKLSILHNNYFGVKASAAWTGSTVNYQTKEFVNNKLITIKQAFRSYQTRADGFIDRVRFLQVNKRYSINGVFSSRTPEEQAKAFLKAGYATDPAYPQKLIDIMSKYKLKQYDIQCNIPLSISTTISTTSPK
jgi:flagellum-specific peptidoglycan hydrolase FlgJ